MHRVLVPGPDHLVVVELAPRRALHELEGRRSETDPVAGGEHLPLDRGSVDHRPVAGAEVLDDETAVVAPADRRVAPGELRVVGEPLEPGSGAPDQQLVADLKREPRGRAADRPQVGDGGRPRPTPVATSGVYHAAAPDEEPSKGPNVWISVIVPSWLTLYALISES